MTSIDDTRARAVADLAEGLVLSERGCWAAPERVFQALGLEGDHRMWVMPGVFDTVNGPARSAQCGRWRASGMTRGEPYVPGR